MEVHHHSTAFASHAGSKKWTHYFWEFLMLFLAVFCGFLAENQREHFVEHHREKQYMGSMFDDLQKDLAMLKENIDFRQSRLRMIDSLVMLLRMPGLGGRANEAYYYARNISPPTNIFSSDGTVQQLKSSGNLRLVRNRDIANAIVAYDQKIRQTLFEMGDEVEIRAEYRIQAVKVFDACVFYDMQQGDSIVMPTAATTLFSNDRALINEMIGRIQYMKRIHVSQLGRSRKLKLMAEELLSMIGEEYELK